MKKRNSNTKTSNRNTKMRSHNRTRMETLDKETEEPKGKERKEVRERELTGERGHAERQREWKEIAKLRDKESRSAGIGTK